MLARICFALLLVACVPAWCQEDASKVEIGSASDQDAPMLVPPPVSVMAYSTAFNGETQSNILSGGLGFTTAWSSNVAWGTQPVSDVIYSLFPTLALDKTTYRSHLVLDYAPGFTFYQRTTSLNQETQNASMKFEYQLTPNLIANIHEGFLKTSNPFDQLNPLAATPVTGALPTAGIAIIAPAADMLTNSTGAQLTYQMDADSMIGAGGNYNVLNYLNPQQVQGLLDSRSAGGSLFYARRFHQKNYFGVSYQYQNSLSFQTNTPSTETQTQTVFFFLTFYLRPKLSISFSGGPQHYDSMQSTQPTATSWQPMTLVSMSWQGERTSVSGSYARTVSGGGGLNGTFHSNVAGAAFAWRIDRNWTSGVSANYSNYQNLTPSFVLSSPGGHTLSGTVSLQRTLSEHANIQFGYSWAQQSYPNFQTVTNIPNINRVFATINFTFSKPLQR
ncbi:MAG TPA: hypothetical protein VK976_05835 [Verrucomicrobiae bacterium]|jgi:hypothetical protein|nr:hypothetical protein [Verrucomicrobiae bacterium]